MNFIIRLLALLPMLAIGITVFILIALSFDMRKTILLIIPMCWAFVIVFNNYGKTVKDVEGLFKTLRQ